MRDGRGQPAKSGHAFFRSDFLLQAPQFRQILEIKHVTTPLEVSRTQGRNAHADVALLAIGRLEFNFPTLSRLFEAMGLPRQPELLVQILQSLTEHFDRTSAKNLFPSPVKESHMPFGVRSEQTTTHRMNDVLGKVLQIEELFSLFFQFDSLA